MKDNNGKESSLTRLVTRYRKSGDGTTWQALYANMATMKRYSCFIAAEPTTMVNVNLQE